MTNATVPGQGTARRVAELLACGVTVQEIADASGVPVKEIRRLPGQRGRLPKHIARAIELADEYLMGPMPPPSDVDWVVVDRMMAGGYDGRSTFAERREAVCRLRERGLSVRETGDVTGLSLRAVQRYRSMGRAQQTTEEAA